MVECGVVGDMQKMYHLAKGSFEKKDVENPPNALGSDIVCTYIPDWRSSPAFTTQYTAHSFKRVQI